MLEFAYPSGSTGTATVTIIGTLWRFLEGGPVGKGGPGFGDPVLSSAPLPLGVFIGAANVEPFIAALTVLPVWQDFYTDPVFTVSALVPVVATVGEMSLYVTYHVVAPGGLPYSVTIFNVTAVPTVVPTGLPPMRSKAGTVTGYFE